MPTVDEVPAVLVAKMEINRGNGRKPDTLNVSKYILKELTFDEVKNMAKEMRTGNSRYEED